MTPQLMIAIVVAGAALLWLAPKTVRRIQLSLAKHPSLGGHAKMAKLMSSVLPFYEYSPKRFFSVDDAPDDITTRRERAFARLTASLRDAAPRSLEATEALDEQISDLAFTNNYRVPFQFRTVVRESLRVPIVVSASEGAVMLKDLDDEWHHDVSGSYGVNLLGYDFYKQCIKAGSDLVDELGPVLGPYHPVIADNVERLRRISDKDEVSFHMSGTEAVMQAVNLARFHTGRPRVVRFCGAYHGWWDGVQPGPGNPRRTNDVYTLKEMDEDTLRVLRTRRDIACVLVNPIQTMHPNATAPGDAMLLASARKANGCSHEAYCEWLQELRDVCTERGIVLIFDEVFLGFRLALRGAQAYFGVTADMVTYGKTLGGGLPVGVVCGSKDLMRRYDPAKPSRICFARGTFNSHPYVLGAMNAFLRFIEDPDTQPDYPALDELWKARQSELNARLEAEGIPVRVGGLSSVWTVAYTTPSRYNWMFQFYLREQRLMLSWVGTGRLIFPHVCSEEDFAAICEKFVAGARQMAAEGWWWQGEKLTNKAIMRAVFREILAARFLRRLVVD